jgi:predicted small secreted protein
MKKSLFVICFLVMTIFLQSSCTKTNNGTGEIEISITAQSPIKDYGVFLLTESAYLNSPFPRVWIAKAVAIPNEKIYFKNVLAGNYILEFARGSSFIYEAIQVVSGQTSYIQR